MQSDPPLTWLKRWESTVSGKVLVKPESCRRGRGEAESDLPQLTAMGPGHVGLGAHLGGGPVNPAFAVGVNIHQHQPFHQVREDELRGKEKGKLGHVVRSLRGKVLRRSPMG